MTHSNVRAPKQITRIKNYKQNSNGLDKHQTNCQHLKAVQTAMATAPAGSQTQPTQAGSKTRANSSIADLRSSMLGRDVA